MTAWCHGAPGVGLSRVRAADYFRDPRFYDEVHVAIENTLKEGLDVNHSLCHGSLGNLELLVEASKSWADPELRARTLRIARGILHSVDSVGRLCGVPSGVETPGLMMGISGIGFGFLRVLWPDLVPSVLLLDPPRPARRPTGGSVSAQSGQKVHLET